jgi:hypothetical protein
MSKEANTIPPLLGCLYCHTEGATVLSPGRRFLGFGGDYPILTCSHCDSVALLDYDPEDPQDWRIRYRRVNRAPRYYYVAIYLGKAGWLSAQKALAASTNGYVQRTRVQQTRAGDLSWLQPAALHPPPPLMGVEEVVYLTLRAVTFQEAPPPGLLVRADQGTVLDSGKFYVTDQKLHLLGQRRDWSHRLSEIHRLEYDDQAWTVVLNTPGQPQQYRGVNAFDQFDPQLVAAVVEALWQQTQAGSVGS